MNEIENIDAAAEELSVMLYSDHDNPTPKLELLNKELLDYSLDSLSHLEGFLSEANEDLASDMDFLRLILRSGSYLGQVIKRNCDAETHWFDYEDFLKGNPEFSERIPKGLGTNAILRSENGMMCFPYSKVMSFLQDGYEDFLREYAQGIILVFKEE